MHGGENYYLEKDNDDEKMGLKSCLGFINNLKPNTMPKYQVMGGGCSFGKIHE